MPNSFHSLRNILLVDDNPNHLEQMLEWLSSRHFNLLQAKNGEQALTILNKRNVELVISDWQLPGVSGVELFSQLRAHGFKGPLLICTGFMLAPEHLQQAFNAGANDYLRKPMNKVEFNACLLYTSPSPRD